MAAVEKLGGPEALFSSNEKQLLAAGLDPSSVNKIIAGRKLINPAEEWRKLEQTGIKTLTIESKGYPNILKEISDPPPILYVRGDYSLLNSPSLAVVGSRKLTSYGRQVIDKLVPELCQMGVSIVSGMAFGADSAALETCVEAGGKPIAVLASSLDYSEISPRSNLRLADIIETRGLLISENPPGRGTHKMYFPLRNRIVSGISVGSLIVEAGLPSGSLLTAKLALEQNREVFAVPGSIFSPLSAGTLDLIKRGAKCVTDSSDIAKEFGWDLKIRQLNMKFDNPLHEKISSILTHSGSTADQIIELSGQPAEVIMPALSEMELIGALRLSKGLYAKIK